MPDVKPFLHVGTAAEFPYPDPTKCAISRLPSRRWMDFIAKTTRVEERDGHFVCRQDEMWCDEEI